ncbi:DUF6314 family protein [Pseudoponticoccus marisrubri]|uniref:Trigger factor n=1 Tax=Pseudoponticoccus marisrubri TaxID=1685382 RepID=A0A0W7WLN2_9RHOB|nr:DUF6314 family protein [Pseudoponticoccus marisrubri]KUF11504.1 trigger factor [Pseudoponticoccus marisrubri]
MSGARLDLAPRELADFLGQWALSREIRHDDGSAARFDGLAEWRPEGDGALYVEQGTLEMPGQGRFAAERRYRWAADLAVFFEDGRYFHQVPARGGTDTHWCDPDRYEVSYDFADWPRWQARWRVRGPRKGYVMVSSYRPAALSG